MAGPTTEYLSVQLDRVRGEVSAISKEVQESRREAIDGLKDLGDTFAAQLGDIREHVGGELARLRQDIGAAREALKMDQSLIREDIVRIQTQTEELISRFDRVLEFLKALLITLITVVVTILATAFTITWFASRVYHAVEEHGQRFEKVEKAEEGQAKLREAIYRIEKTLDSRLPAASK